MKSIDDELKEACGAEEGTWTLETYLAGAHKAIEILAERGVEFDEASACEFVNSKLDILTTTGERAAAHLGMREQHSQDAAAIAAVREELDEAKEIVESNYDVAREQRERADHYREEANRMSKRADRFEVERDELRAENERQKQTIEMLNREYADACKPHEQRDLELADIRERAEGLVVALNKISRHETLDGDKYVNYEQAWIGVANFAGKALEKWSGK